MTTNALRRGARQSMTAGRLIRSGSCGLGAALLVAACSAGSASTTGSHPPAATATATATAQPVRLLASAPLPKHINNTVALRRNVIQTSCAAIPGGWSAAGNVHNPSSKAAAYEITVFFTTTHATTLDFAVATVEVAGRATTRWTATKKFGAEAQMLCPMPGIAQVR